MSSPIRAGAWSTGLFDVCAEPGGASTCVYATLFPTCAFGEMAKDAPPGSFPCAGSCFGSCCLMGIIPGLLNCLAHGGLRAAYGIQGGCCEDLLAGCFCTPCSICQQSREVRIRKAATISPTQAWVPQYAPPVQAASMYVQQQPQPMYVAQQQQQQQPPMMYQQTPPQGQQPVVYTANPPTPYPKSR